MSKELEALETLVYGLTNDNYKKEDLGITMSKCREIIRNALKDYEKQKQLVQTLQDKIYVKEMKYAKQEQALEIIKEKRFDITFFDTYIKWSWEKYQNRKLKCSEKELTKEEFELLKEILDD